MAVRRETCGPSGNKTPVVLTGSEGSCRLSGSRSEMGYRER
jgi:hypothetical protein